MYLYIWRRKWQLTSVFLPEKCHGQWILVGYPLWGHKKARHDLATKQQLYPLHLAPLSPFPFHPSRSFQIIRLGFLLYSSFPLDTYQYFTHDSLSVSMLLSQFVLPSPSPPAYTSPFPMSASTFLLCKYIHLHYFPRFYIYMCVLICDICFSLSECFPLYNRLQILPPHCN